MPHAAEPRIPGYQPTGTDEIRLSGTQSQRRTKAAYSEKILKLRLSEAEKEAHEEENVPGKLGTKNGRNSRNRELPMQHDS